MVLSNYTFEQGGEAIYIQLSKMIEEDIASGRLQIGERMLSDKDLAGKLSISPVTVTKAYSRLVKKGLVSRKTGQGTFVSRSRKRSGVIAMLCNEYVSDWTGVIANELSVELGRAGFKLQLMNASSFDPVKGKELIESIDPDEIDGVFAITMPGFEYYYEQLRNSGVAVLMGCRAFKKLPYITFDDFRIGELAAEHLLELGITDPGAVIEDYQVGRERLFGFLNGYAKAGIVIPDNRVFWVNQPSLSEAELDRLLSWESFPQALFAHGDVFLVQVYHELLRRRTLRVPEDVLMVGVGNAFDSHHVPLTSVDYRLAELGRRAAAILIDMLENRYNPEPGCGLGQKVEPVLCRRTSTEI